MILSLFRKDSSREAGEALYAAAVEQARSPALYADLGAPDTVEGRFEMVGLHVFLILRRIKAGDDQAKNTGQALFEAMFQNMDDALRELGVGDLSVGKKIRKMAENFYGRAAAYEDGLNEKAPPEALAKAIGRNVFGDETAPAAIGLAAYVARAAATLEAQPAGRVVAGIVAFPDFEGAS